MNNYYSRRSSKPQSQTISFLRRSAGFLLMGRMCAQPVVTTIMNGLTEPMGLSYSPDGSNALVADRGGNILKRIDLSTNAVTVLAGNGQGTCTDGIGTNARFN